jgi:hypothetical protein
MIPESDILSITRKLQIELGQSISFEIISLKYAKKNKKDSNSGALYIDGKYDKDKVRTLPATVFIVKEKMTSKEKCLFAVSQQICRKRVMPGKASYDVQLGKIISSYEHDFSSLEPVSRNFRNILYDLLATSWILSISKMSIELKNDIVNFGIVYYTKRLKDIENMDNEQGRTLYNQWEMYYRLQIKLMENYSGKKTPNSIDILDKEQRDILTNIISFLPQMAKYFWTDGYTELLNNFNNIYYQLGNHIDDKKEKPKDDDKEKVHVTYLDGEVFYQRCKNEGLSDNDIKSYFDRIKGNKRIEVTGISQDSEIREWI